VGEEVGLRDPERDDYRPREGSVAEAYGCQTFAARVPFHGSIQDPAPPVGILLSGSEIQVGGLISENTTWDADIVRVIDSVEVAGDVSLTIAPGTVVEFAGDYRLLVRGRLWAVGGPDERITFTATAEQQALGWDGLEFLNIPADRELSRLEHCDISFAVAKAIAVNDPRDGGTTRPGTGGAISIVGVNNLEISSCIFFNNSAEYGGAIYCGYGASPVLAGNLFYNNSATWQGSVLFNVYAYPKLANNTMADNVCQAESSFHMGSAVDNFNGKIVMLGNIVRNNFTNHYSGMQLHAPKDYYIVANNIEAYVGNGSNMDVDAGFVDYGAFPYQLLGSSLCIESGIDDPLLKALSDDDIAGNARVCGVSIDLGAFEYCGSVSFAHQSVPASLAPELTCHPNPFNPRTKIVFDLPAPCFVNLSVFDLQGRLLGTLVEDHRLAGRHEIPWQGCDAMGQPLASGTYLYQLRAAGYNVTRTMTLIR
jgi:predicted outer membrane repeat protein